MKITTGFRKVSKRRSFFEAMMSFIILFHITPLMASSVINGDIYRRRIVPLVIVALVYFWNFEKSFDGICKRHGYVWGVWFD